MLMFWHALSETARRRYDKNSILPSNYSFSFFYREKQNKITFLSEYNILDKQLHKMNTNRSHNNFLDCLLSKLSYCFKQAKAQKSRTQHFECFAAVL